MSWQFSNNQLALAVYRNGSSLACKGLQRQATV